jgi:hypothetical protein
MSWSAAIPERGVARDQSGDEIVAVKPTAYGPVLLHSAGTATWAGCGRGERSRPGSDPGPGSQTQLFREEVGDLAWWVDTVDVDRRDGGESGERVRVV